MIIKVVTYYLDKTKIMRFKEANWVLTKGGHWAHPTGLNVPEPTSCLLGHTALCLLSKSWGFYTLDRKISVQKALG